MTREEAIKVLKRKIDCIECGALCSDFGNDKEVFRMAIEALEQEPKTGHWIGHREHCENFGVMPSGLSAYEWCSNCDCGIDVREWYRNNYNYCPNCGAKMVKPQESEDK